MSKGPLFDEDPFFLSIKARSVLLFQRLKGRHNYESLYNFY
ncbi:hypothetical protein M899_1083 [Bacteriovorax sp. BSW11_IV]|nr:hypothetical protein M899_1083 [Bacteriovorax sp. BSW11_IV]